MQLSDCFVATQLTAIYGVEYQWIAKVDFVL